METTLSRDTNSFVENCLLMAKDVMRIHTKRTWIDYDEEADVLYVSFRRPQRVTSTVEVGEDVLLRKDQDDIVGITIMNARLKMSN